MRIIRFTKYIRYCVTGSALILLAGIISIIYHRGLEFGIDFTGGVQITYLMSKPISNDEMGLIRSGLQAKGITPDLQTSADQMDLYVKIKGLSYIDDGINKLRKFRKDGKRIASVDDLKPLFTNVPAGVLDEAGTRYAYLAGQTLPDINTVALAQLDETIKNIYTAKLGDLMFEVMHAIFAKDTPLDKSDLNYINAADEINEIVSDLQARRVLAFLSIPLENPPAGVAPTVRRQLDSLDALASLDELNGVAMDKLQSRFTTKKSFGTEELRININEVEDERLYQELYTIIKELNLQSCQKIMNHKTNLGGLYRERAEVETLEGIRPSVLRDIKENFVLGTFVLASNETVGASIGATLKQQAVYIMFFCFASMGIYIFWRFKYFSFALGAIIAIFHDVILSVGIFSILGKEFDIPVIASVMTLMGYSINDTIIIFDRIRENTGLMKRAPMDEIIDVSTTQTISRTIGTSLTTLFTSLAVYVFGPEPTRNFALLFTIGVVTGTYSSIYIASPIVLYFDKKHKSVGKSVPTGSGQM